MGVEFTQIAGNVSLKRRVSQDISNNTLSHAYIIEGPCGSGRHTLALNIAAALSCDLDNERPCGSCKSCERIFGGKSPDIVVHGFVDDRVTIGVDTIRNIREDMVIAPNDLGIKVYIIENADAMTIQAQNAFLLSLEDPPKYVMFFLICESSSSLLETVRSRAPVLRLQRLDDAELKKYVLDHSRAARNLYEDDPEAFEILTFVADGCIGKALSLLDSRKLKALLDEREIAEKILSLLSCPNKTEVLSVVTALGRKRADVRRYLLSVQTAVRDLLMLKKDDSVRLCFFPDREEAQELSTHYTSASLISLYDALCGACEELDGNSNVRLTLLNMCQKAGII